MKLQRLLGKAVCVVSAAALFLMPLAACDDDSDSHELRGMQVTEQEWNDRIAKIDNADLLTAEMTEKFENYTDSTLNLPIFNTIEEGQFYAGQMVHKINLVYSRTANVSYIYTTEISNSYVNRKRNEYRIEQDIIYFVTKIDNDIMSEYEVSQDYNVNPWLTMQGILDAYEVNYSDFIYDELDGSFGVVLLDECMGEYLYNYSFKFYFYDDNTASAVFFVKCIELSNNNCVGIYSQDLHYNKDIGITTIEVPDEVYAAIEEYKANEGNR